MDLFNSENVDVPNRSDAPPSAETTDSVSAIITDEALDRLKLMALKLDLALRVPVQVAVAPLRKSIGPFPVLRTLGSGGGGVVYLALDPVLGREIAIKVPHGSTLLCQNSLARFHQEAKLISELRHANIVEVFQAGDADGCPFLVLEYCEGGSLADWLAQQTEPLPPEQCAEMILALSRAVQYAHGRGILHRDVKPRNVLLIPLSPAEKPTANSRLPFMVKLSDFGLGTWLDEHRTAVQTQSGAVMGTLPYMAPEQTRAAKIPHQATIDVYALGVILYELLTRRLPFSDETLVETLRLIHESDPMPPRRLRKSIPRDLETICLKCLEKSPAARYATAGQLADDLELFLAGNLIHARRMNGFQRTVRWIKRHRIRLGMGSVAITAFVAVIAGGSWLLRELENSRGTEHTLKTISAETAGKLEQTRANEQALIKRNAEQAARSHRSEYLHIIQTIAAMAQSRSMDKIQMLREWIPQSDETDLRGFEWYYLMQSCGGDVLPIRPLSDRSIIEDLAVSSDGRSIFTASTNSIVRWDLETGLPSGSETGFHPAVRSLAVSHKFNYLLAPVYDSCDVAFVNLVPTPFQDRREFVVPAPFQTSRVIFTPDEQSCIAIASRDPSGHAPTILQWYSRVSNTNTIQNSLTWPDGRVFDAVFDPVDHSLIVGVTNDIEVYDQSLRRTQCLKLPGHGLLLSLSASPDGRQLAASAEDGTVFLCAKDAKGQWATREILIESTASPPIADEDLVRRRNPVQFSTSGTRLSQASRSGLSLFDVTLDQVPRKLNSLEMDRFLRVKSLPDGETFAWASFEMLGLWRPIPNLPMIEGHQKEAWSVAFSPDGKLLASGSDDESICIWSRESHQKLAELTGHSVTVTHVAFSPDGKSLASASLDGTARIWDMENFQLKKILSGQIGPMRTLTWFGDGKRIATSDSPNQDAPPRVIIWDLDLTAQVQALAGFSDRIHQVLVTENGSHVVGVSDDTSIRMWDVNSGALKWMVHDDSAIRCAALLKDDLSLAVGNNGGVISLREMTTGKFIRRFVGHTGQILSLAVSPDGRLLASGSLDQTIRLWDTETGRCLIVIDNQKCQINGLAFSPSGEILVAALHDGSVKQFYAPRFRPLQFDR